MRNQIFLVCAFGILRQQPWEFHYLAYRKESMDQVVGIAWYL